MNERLAEAELHLRFRLAIPHAGPDPKYTLQSSSRYTQQGARQEQQAFSLLSPPSSSTSSQFSGNVSLNANVPQEEEAEGEGYAEPAYITRQRCLVLNDWGLSLFESGEYTKVWNMDELVIRVSHRSQVAKKEQDRGGRTVVLHSVVFVVHALFCLWPCVNVEQRRHRARFLCTYVHVVVVGQNIGGSVAKRRLQRLVLF